MVMLEIPADQLPALMEPYLKMQDALASDELDAAKAQAKAMMSITGHSGSLPELLHDMLAAETLDAFRVPFFEKPPDSEAAPARDALPDGEQQRWGRMAASRRTAAQSVLRISHAELWRSEGNDRE
jgi:hypothetical protein